MKKASRPLSCLTYLKATVEERFENMVVFVGMKRGL